MGEFWKDIAFDINNTGNQEKVFEDASKEIVEFLEDIVSEIEDLEPKMAITKINTFIDYVKI